MKYRMRYTNQVSGQRLRLNFFASDDEEARELAQCLLGIKKEKMGGLVMSSLCRIEFKTFNRGLRHVDMQRVVTLIEGRMQ